MTENNEETKAMQAAHFMVQLSYVNYVLLADVWEHAQVIKPSRMFTKIIFLIMLPRLG